MKKQIRVSIATLFVLTILLSSTSYVMAAPLNGGPSISPSSGGGTATLTNIPVSKLPGTEANAAGTLFPQGHSNGDMMFSGSGVQVSDLVGYATLSLPLASFAQGWTGYIYQWLNESWVKLPTTVTQDVESSNGTASATIYSNGIYALIVTYKLPDEKVIKECVDITFIYPDFDWEFGSDDIQLIGGYVVPAIPVDTTVRYELIHIQPAGAITGDLSATGIVVENISIGDGAYSYVEFPEGTILTSSYDWWSELSFTVRFYTMGCYKDFDWPADFSLG